jgi:general secretion pathway protein F
MRTFEYKGFNEAGQIRRGLIEALDLKDAREKLSHQGILAEAVQAAGRGRLWVWRRRDVTFALDTRAAFYRELGSVLAAGLPLSNALALLVDAPEMGNNRSLIAGIRDRIGEGMPLAGALQQASPRVTAFEAAVVGTGEHSGRLDEVMGRLADYLDEERRLRDRLISALIYPAVIMVLSLVVGMAMLFFMLPAFRNLLEESGLDLPAVTRAVMAIARISAWLLPVFLLVVVAGAAWFRSRWQADETFRIAADRRLHGIPVYRSFYAVLVNIRFTRTLAMLLGSGLPLLEALSQAARACGSPWVENRVEEEAEAVRHGSALSDALSRIPPLSGTLPGWVRAGEASGDLQGMLNHAADRSQQVWERWITRTMTMVESALVIVVGVFVFILALSIILPILSLNQALQ